MKEYWLIDNMERAEYYTLCMLTGMLEYRQEKALPVTAKEILQYIEEHIRTEEARLNERYPAKAC